jgi:hypothetical protein
MSTSLLAQVFFLHLDIIANTYLYTIFSLSNPQFQFATGSSSLSIPFLFFFAASVMHDKLISSSGGRLYFF